MVAIAIGFGIGVVPRIILDSTDQFAAVISSALIDLTNADRSANAVPTLLVSPFLQQAAQAKADDMARNGYFAHVSPSGVTPWHWFSLVGYDYSAAGENLAIDFFQSADVERAWMNSPFHRANILNNTFTEIGIATATGTYEGHETTFVVQMFGRPLSGKTSLPAQPLHVIASTTDFAAVER